MGCILLYASVCVCVCTCTHVRTVLADCLPTPRKAFLAAVLTVSIVTQTLPVDERIYIDVYTIVPNLQR
uniref:Putative secreted protein n=1 Tax=Rhipicephalus microplus TaxID=6941 RepID=A0A6M2DEM8_RHIMP